MRHDNTGETTTWEAVAWYLHIAVVLRASCQNDRNAWYGSALMPGKTSLLPRSHSGLQPPKSRLVRSHSLRDTLAPSGYGLLRRRLWVKLTSRSHPGPLILTSFTTSTHILPRVRAVVQTTTPRPCEIYTLGVQETLKKPPTVHRRCYAL